MTILKNRRILVPAALCLIVLAVWGVGYIVAEKENPFKVAVTLYFLNDSERDTVRIALDEHRYITMMGEGLEERIIANVSSLSNDLRGGSEWKILEHEDGYLRLAQEYQEETREIEMIYTPYLNRYVIFGLKEHMS
ncbi:hypothetical protein [Caldalkalibacillus salinus]|uniref:hypothetical protein n=1 Tax=Caldalkalibacillus salinus TaxID=2803787 RepID=UPI001921539A|nr:hypothetical protein [Caldalkalibacillus salinus]